MTTHLTLGDLPLIQQRMLQEMADNWEAKEEILADWGSSGEIHLWELEATTKLVERRWADDEQGYEYRRTATGRALIDVPPTPPTILGTCGTCGQAANHAADCERTDCAL